MKHPKSKSTGGFPRPLGPPCMVESSRVAAISPFHLDRDRRLMLLKDRDASRLSSLPVSSGDVIRPD